MEINEADILATTYEDVMDVYRVVLTEDENTGVSSRGLKEVSKGVRCALSKSTLPVVDNSIGGAPVEYTVFCRPNVDVKEGDKIVLTRFDKVYELYVGYVMDYVSHKEIPVRRKERI